MVLYPSALLIHTIVERTSFNIDQVFLGQCLSRDWVGTILFDVSLNQSFFIYCSRGLGDDRGGRW